MKRLKRTILVLAALLAAYGVYAVLVVPFVEPTVAIQKGTRPGPPPTHRANKLESLFPKGAWELNRPKVVETEQGTLMFEDYRPLPDGRMELTKCTVIAHVEGKSVAAAKTPAGESGLTAPSERRPIVIRAPQGAVLHFDQPLNVMRGEFGRLTGGQLNGEVTITSPPTTPGGDDGLQVQTRQLQIDPQRIWTPHEVQFQYGPNRGRGRVLVIQLASSQRGPQVGPSLGVSGVRSIELSHLEHLNLLLNNQGLFGSSAKNTRGANERASDPPTPVDVSCQGPLKLDLDRQWISLEDQVELRRRHAAGASDQLSCQKLEIHFTGGSRLAAVAKKSERTASAGGTAVAGPPPKLMPTRVVATGRPVTIRAASMGVGARAERIEYDCVLQRVWLQDPDKVMFHDPQREVEAKEIRYALGPDQRLGELWAQGPGVVRGELGRDARRFDVTWQDQVQLRRIDQEPVLSFNARVALQVAELGHFAGDSMHLYLRETPRPDRPDRYVASLDRLQALGNVRMDSPEWEAELDEARIWFKAAAGRDPGPSPNRSSTATPAGFFGTPDEPNGDPRNPNPAIRRSRYRLRAQTIEAVVAVGPRTAADLVIVRGRVAVDELGSETSEAPLRLRGEHFELQDGASDRPRAALLGSPAEIDVRGVQARGSKFHLHPRDNFFEVVGTGEMRWTPTMSPPPPGSTVVPPQLPAVIAWDGRMQFDGLLARFEQNVAVRGSQLAANGEVTHYLATGDTVRAEMSHQIFFEAPTKNGPVQVAEVAFEGWGFLQTEIIAPTGDRKLFEQLQVIELAVHLISGEIRGNGPGWARGIHRGRDLAAESNDANPLSAAAGQANPDQPLAPPAGLHFLRVDFQREVAGNLHQKRLEFRHGTKTLYGPVQNWDDFLDRDDSALPPKAIVLTCDRLAVMQSGQPGLDGIEIEATGNANLRGESFTASGERVSYVRFKDQFVLEGDGRNDARIEFQSPGGNRPGQFVAGKILYWPKTGQCQVVDLRQTELFDIGQLRGRGAPKVQPR